MESWERNCPLYNLVYFLPSRRQEVIKSHGRHNLQLSVTGSGFEVDILRIHYLLNHITL
jgi:hypothetical protein